MEALKPQPIFLECLTSRRGGVTGTEFPSRDTKHLVLAILLRINLIPY